jgi:hypothetical protein
MMETNHIRVSIRKSRTVASDHGNFEKTEYSIEQDLPDGLNPGTGLRNLEAIVDKLLDEKNPANYDDLPWKKSMKKAQLSTTPVTAEMPSLARELYDKLKNSEQHAIKIDDRTYKISSYEGTEFLQRWARTSE